MRPGSGSLTLAVRMSHMLRLSPGKTLWCRPGRLKRGRLLHERSDRLGSNGVPGGRPVLVALVVERTSPAFIGGT